MVHPKSLRTVADMLETVVAFKTERGVLAIGPGDPLVPFPWRGEASLRFVDTMAARLGLLSRVAARTLRAYVQAALGERKAVPGLIACVQTFGSVVHWHRHLHVSDAIRMGRIAGR
jgi:hypothetical protein